MFFSLWCACGVVFCSMPHKRGRDTHHARPFGAGLYFADFKRVSRRLKSQTFSSSFSPPLLLSTLRPRPTRPLSWRLRHGQPPLQQRPFVPPKPRVPLRFLRKRQPPSDGQQTGHTCPPERAAVTHPLQRSIWIDQQNIMKLSRRAGFRLDHEKLPELFHALAPSIYGSLSYKSGLCGECGRVLDDDYWVVRRPSPEAEQSMPRGLPLRLHVDGLHDNRQRSWNRCKAIICFAMPQEALMKSGKM